jgi:release factor glutamine methyltransferase
MPILADICGPAFLTIMADKKPFDIIISNPPYIPLREYQSLSSSVKDFEDPRALLGDPLGIDGDGLSFYRLIARLVSQHGLLSNDGCVVLEVGDGQSTAVESIMKREGGIRATEIWLDPWEKQRVVFGYL